MDTELDRPRWRSTANVRLLHTLQVGVEYNPVAGEIAPLATWFLMTEGPSRPAVFLGTSSDRIGSPEGKQATYLTAAKQLPWYPIAPYVSLNYSEWDDRFNVPFGANAWIGAGFSVQPMYDGDRGHLVLNYAAGRCSASLLYVWFERFGAAVSAGF